ncbi:rhamnulokinase [Listeria costaricensis]|uniref:rhamnulokinase n=1 Tax=Listeria costaricensis TaxID=2026604 RepID=UPI000C074AEB|nr:rhamnulokinase family protein [Listeria costaricensis]
MGKSVLAFDFGATSGRAIIGRLADGRLSLEEVHRFDNGGIMRDGTLQWDIVQLFTEMKTALQKAAATTSLESVGVDTWGVDYGLLDRKGELLVPPVHYRDPRTEAVFEKALTVLSREELYQLTGNQAMSINSLFQLLAEREQQPERFRFAGTFLMMPDLFNYLLTGRRFAERSIASTSQLLDPRTGDWQKEILTAYRLTKALFPPLIDPGTLVGTLQPILAEELGIPEVKVVAVCGHDTASAVAAVPKNLEEEALFISCGTWSIVGTELNSPVMTTKAFLGDLTNERGYGGTTQLLKNITGLWVLEECKRYLESQGRAYDYQQIAALAQESRPFACLIDTDDVLFQAPGNMVARMEEYARKTGQNPPRSDGEIFRTIYESLALKYAAAREEIERVIGYRLSEVYLMGGGAQAELLCQMTAEAMGGRVLAGPVEATAAGNIALQLLALEEFESIQEARQMIRQSFSFQTYEPRECGWSEQKAIFRKLLKEGEGAC